MRRDQPIGPGEVVAGKYHILESLGQGGMANVWLARDERLGKLWAVKEIKSNADGVRGAALRDALVREAHLMKRLDHPAIPRVVDILYDGSTTFVVMDYVEGRSLAACMHDQGSPFEQGLVVSWGIQLCDVLDYLHTLHPCVVYRDLKPANVILKEDGSVRLIDFGAALVKAPEGDEGLALVGTPGYAAPEQLAAEGDKPLVDGRADLYALGVTLYVLASGHAPKASTANEFRMRPLREWNAALSEGLEHIISQAMTKDVTERYQSAREMRYDLAHCAQLTHEWRQAMQNKVVFVRNLGLATCLCALLGASSLYGSWRVGRSTFQGLMHTAELASPQSEGDRASEAEELCMKAMAQDPAALEPYALLLDIYRSDFLLTDAESRRLGEAFANLQPRPGDPRYAQLCFDVGVCYLSYFGVERGGGTVGNTALQSVDAAAPWFARALEACEEDEEGSVLSSSDRQAAEVYGVISSFYSRMSRAEREGTEPSQEYRALWEALSLAFERENTASVAQRSAEGVRARLCQAGVEILSSPTYLAGFARAGITEAEARHQLARVAACWDGLDTFAGAEEFQVVYGPLFVEVREGLQLAEGNMRTVFQNPVARGVSSQGEGAVESMGLAEGGHR